jgi:hypothetical protein
MNDLDWKMPALVGGLITGVLSALPVVSSANCCFCGWALFGGAIAAKMLIGRTPRQVKSGEGAKVGLMAGLIAAAVCLPISILLILSGAFEEFQNQMMSRMGELFNDPNIQAEIERIIEENRNKSAAEKFIGSLVILVPYSILIWAFCVLGGLIGVALFENRKDLPPAPPQYHPPSTPTYPSQSPPQSGGE